jgi:hypothetical protein
MLQRCSVIALATGVLLVAQHGGGHGSTSGGHASYGNSSVGHGYSGSYGPRVTYPTPIGVQPQATGLIGINDGAYGNKLGYRGPVSTAPVKINRTIRSPERGYQARGYYGLPYYPYLGYGYGNDWYAPTDDSYYGAPPPDGGSDQGTANLLGEQIQQLGAQVQALREAQQGPPPLLQAPPPASDPPPASSPVVLVLKNGQKIDVQNYAIMNGVLWDFSKPNSKRIPLANIDGPASEKATDAAGGSLPEGSFGVNPN